MSGLKNARGQLESRQDRLQKGFKEFRDSFLKTLKEFSKEEMQNGLGGVKPYVLKESGDLVEASLSVNGFDLVVYADFGAAFLDLKARSDVLASKMFVYYAGSDENSASVMDVTFEESSEPSHRWEVRIFAADGRAHSVTKGKQPPDTGGREAGLALLCDFTRRRRAWRHNVPRGAYLKKKPEERYLGFRTPSDE